MSWLLHNMVADLYGPYFLAFYALAIGAVIVACYRSVRSVDRTQDSDPPQIPVKLDPYEIAFLRGGENEVARVAIASLAQRGLLRITEENTPLARSIDHGRRPKSGELGSIEACVLKWPGFPARPDRLFEHDGVVPMLQELCAPYDEALAEKNLLNPPEMKQAGIRLWALGSTIILGLGGYKLWAALMNGHSNVLFLCILGVAGVIGLGFACMIRPRQTHLGKAYLDRTQVAFLDLKHVRRRDEKQAHVVNVSGVPEKAHSAAADNLLAVGIFGLAALDGTPLADLNSMFARSTSSGGGCGSAAGGGGCGGGGCGGGGGGCGGCGGGGS